MPPTSKKLMGHIGLGLCVHACVCPSVMLCMPAGVCPSVTLCIWSRTDRDRILKFEMWNKYEK